MDTLTQEQMEELNAPSAEEEKAELEKRIELLEMSRLNLRVTPVVFDRLLKQAEFHGISVEEHAVGIIEQSLVQQVGRPVINAPSVIGQTPQQKVKGPSLTPLVQRG
jgi:hypothetical protein